MMLHIVEPTLNSYAGHCHSLVDALTQAMPSMPVQIWAGRRSRRYWTGAGDLHPFFFRPLRRLQVFWLYWKLLRSDGKVLISTAGTSDFLALDLVSSTKIPKGKVYLYVHWVGAKRHKAEKLQRIAHNQPNLEVLTTTETVAEFFRGVGFRARAVPYPVAAKVNSVPSPIAFRRLVVAGAARMDKGFDKIVDLVDHLKSINSSLPIVVQASATHQDKHPPAVQTLIARLMRINYMPLQIITETLTPQDYRELFDGGISVQPYSAEAFQDRVSGVTLDALGAGCPVLVTANTWLARTVQQHGAGVSVPCLGPDDLLSGVNEILADYDAYSQRAFVAGDAVRASHSASAMVNALFLSGD